MRSICRHQRGRAKRKKPRPRKSGPLRKIPTRPTSRRLVRSRTPNNKKSILGAVCARLQNSRRYVTPPNAAAKASASARSAKHQRMMSRSSSRRPPPRCASVPRDRCQSYIRSSRLPRPPGGTTISTMCGKSRSTALEPERPSVKKRRLREVRAMSALPQKVEHSAIHSITSSALASRVGGTVRPSAVTVFRLMTVSYSVGACTGRSASLPPLRMRSIKNVRPGLGGGPVRVSS